jgi:hypothetical protein
MIKITGLDKLQKQLDQAKRALKELDGELGAVSCDPHDPVSIEAAIQSIYQTVDERAGEDASNPIISPLIAQMKESYRERLLQQAAAARLRAEGAE